jgi:uncharacterized protein (UPF0335 family)
MAQKYMEETSKHLQKMIDDLTNMNDMVRDLCNKTSSILKKASDMGYDHSTMDALNNLHREPDDPKRIEALRYLDTRMHQKKPVAMPGRMPGVKPAPKRMPGA